MSTYDRTKGHSLKLNKSRIRTDLRQHFFSDKSYQYLEQTW